MTSRAFIDEIRSLDFSSISASYAAVGSAVTIRPRIIVLSNNTQGDMMFTDDLTKDKMFLAAGAFRLIDISANMMPARDDGYRLPEATQFYVKQITAPVSGSVYIEIWY